MKKSNFARLLLCLTAVLILVVTGSAQIATITDGTCSVADVCTGVTGHGCTSTNFTVPTTGSYQLKATVDQCGTTTACSECKTEAYIYKADNPPSEVLCVHSGPCCNDQHASHELVSGITYILYCCKLDCDGDNCDNCPETCTARATVTGPN